VIVVEDAATDGTPELLKRWQREHGAVVVRQPNRGKGAVIRATVPRVEADIVLIQDADMEYDPSDVPALIQPIERGVADVVCGSRLSGGRPPRPTSSGTSSATASSRW
jgi:glycosyltransferase involved in cell wall biosynthesis